MLQTTLTTDDQVPQTNADLYKHAFRAVQEHRRQDAEQILRQILRGDPHYADAYLLLSRIAGDAGRLHEQLELAGKALSLDLNNGEYRAEMGKCCVKILDFDNALIHAAKAEAALHNSAVTWDAVASIYAHLGRHDKAASLFRKALQLEKDNPHIYFNLATTLKACGDFDGAQDAFERVIELKPEYHKAHAGLASLRRTTREHNNITRLKSLIEQSDNREATAHLCHAASKELEAVGEYDEAFAYLKKAKTGLLELAGDPDRQDEDMFAGLFETFSQQSRFGDGGSASSEPIFIVGMPRSGTTLVERIISNHRDVCSVGELLHFSLILRQMTGSDTPRVLDRRVSELAPKSAHFSVLGKGYVDSARHFRDGSPRFVDKFHLNFLLCGFIVNALPRAKIVCLDRNPLDTIVGNYRQLFEILTTSFNYSLKLSSTARYYAHFRETTALWRRLYPENFYSVNYESLVSKPETETRKLLAFCNLDWQQDCEKIEKNEKPIATASSVQVRQPVHKRFVGNWRKFDAHLEEAKDVLRSKNIKYEI